MIFHYPKNITLKSIVAFMDLFNNIQIAKWDEHGNITRILRVPISFASKEKILAILENPALLFDVNLAEGTPTKVEFNLLLPRMAVSLNGITYDPARKINKLHKFVNKDGTQFLYMPVPYNLSLSLHIMSKTLFDTFQIVEQILPFFSPEYTVDIKFLGDEFPSESVPIVLESVNFDVPVDFGPEDQRIILAQLDFTMKINYHFFKMDAKKILKVITNVIDMDTIKKFLTYTVIAKNPEPIYPPEQRDKEPKEEIIEDYDNE